MHATPGEQARRRGAAQKRASRRADIRGGAHREGERRAYVVFEVRRGRARVGARFSKSFPTDTRGRFGQRVTCRKRRRGCGGRTLRVIAEGRRGSGSQIPPTHCSSAPIGIRVARQAKGRASSGDGGGKGSGGFEMRGPCHLRSGRPDRGGAGIGSFRIARHPPGIVDTSQLLITLADFFISACRKSKLGLPEVQSPEDPCFRGAPDIASIHIAAPRASRSRR
jgi:hypothetical protein